MIHGDVKPQNILIGEDGRSRLADFDLSADTATRTSKSFPTSFWSSPLRRCSLLTFSICGISVVEILRIDDEFGGFWARWVALESEVRIVRDLCLRAYLQSKRTSAVVVAAGFTEGFEAGISAQWPPSTRNVCVAEMFDCHKAPELLTKGASPATDMFAYGRSVQVIYQLRRELQHVVPADQVRS